MGTHTEESMENAMDTGNELGLRFVRDVRA